jgi:uncharacterized protein
MPKAYKSKAMAAIHETMLDLHEGGAIDRATLKKFDDICLAARPVAKPAAAKVKGRAKPGLQFTVFKDAGGQWRWQLTASNQKIIATSGEGYTTKANCLAAIELVKTSQDSKVAA